MNETVMGKDGQVHTLLDRWDLIFLVEEYAGYEVSHFLEKTIEELETEIQDLQAELQELTKEMEQERDNNHDILITIREETEAAQEILEGARLNRKKLDKVLLNIWNIAHGEL